MHQLHAPLIRRNQSSSTSLTAPATSNTSLRSYKATRALHQPYSTFQTSKHQLSCTTTTSSIPLIHEAWSPRKFFEPRPRILSLYSFGTSFHAPASCITTIPLTPELYTSLTAPATSKLRILKPVNSLYQLHESHTTILHLQSSSAPASCTSSATTLLHSPQYFQLYFRIRRLANLKFYFVDIMLLR